MLVGHLSNDNESHYSMHNNNISTHTAASYLNCTPRQSAIIIIVIIEFFVWCTLPCCYLFEFINCIKMHFLSIVLTLSLSFRISFSLSHFKFSSPVVSLSLNFRAVLILIHTIVRLLRRANVNLFPYAYVLLLLCHDK